MQYYGGFEVELDEEDLEDQESPEQPPEVKNSPTPKEDQKEEQHHAEGEIEAAKLDETEAEEKIEITTKKAPPAWMEKALTEDAENHENHAHAEEEKKIGEIASFKDDPSAIQGVNPKIAKVKSVELDSENISSDNSNSNPDWEKVIQQRKLHLAQSKSNLDDQHRDMSYYTKIMEELGFDEKEIHEKLKTGSFDKVKKEIEHKTENLNKFINDFSRILVAFGDNKEQLQIHMDELFDKVAEEHDKKEEILDLIDKFEIHTIDGLYKMKAKNPKVFRMIVENYVKLGLDASLKFNAIAANHENLRQISHEKYIDSLEAESMSVIGSGMNWSNAYFMVMIFMSAILLLLLGTKKLQRNLRGGFWIG